MLRLLRYNANPSLTSHKAKKTMKPDRMPMYILHPGFGATRRGGPIEYIDERALARLYGVKPAECLVLGRSRYKQNDKDVHLMPSKEGIYSARPPLMRSR